MTNTNVETIVETEMKNIVTFNEIKEMIENKRKINSVVSYKLTNKNNGETLIISDKKIKSIIGDELKAESDFDIEELQIKFADLEKLFKDKKEAKKPKYLIQNILVTGKIGKLELKITPLKELGEITNIGWGKIVKEIDENGSLVKDNWKITKIEVEEEAEIEEETETEDVEIEEVETEIEEVEEAEIEETEEKTE